MPYTPTRRFAAAALVVPLACLAVPVAPTAQAAAPAHRVTYDPTGRTAVQVEQDLASRLTTSVGLVRSYEARIAAFNRRGPRIDAVLEVDPTAVAQAGASDRRRRHHATRGPLDGVPVLVKDNIDIKGMVTAAGSIALRHNVARQDSPAVGRLRAAGAIILGHTNMSELAASYGRLGYSSIGGTVLNPVDTRRNASGSSSGSAAAVAASFSTLALGTDTSGSVRGPASAVGLVGLRPTLGAVSTGGVVPVSSNLDVVGPLGRTAQDVAQLYSALTGSSVTPASAATSLKGRRIGVVAGFDGANADVAAAQQRTIAQLRAQGAVPVPVTLSAAAGYAWTPVVGPLSDLDFAKDMDDYLSTTGPGTPKTLGAVYAALTSKAATSSAYPPNPARVAGIKQSLDDASQWGGASYRDALVTQRDVLRREVLGVMDAQHLDALAYPTMECPASPVWDEADPSYECSSTDEYAPSYLSPATGFPEVTVPVSLGLHGLPIGFSLLGRPWSEASLLPLAGGLQAATGAHAATPSVPGLH